MSFFTVKGRLMSSHKHGHTPQLLRQIPIALPVQLVLDVLLHGKSAIAEPFLAMFGRMFQQYS